MEARQLKVRGEAPLLRGYHTANAVGDCCYILGGRNLQGLMPLDDCLACFDTRQHRWVPLGRTEGTPPSPPRTSHRCLSAVPVMCHLCLCLLDPLTSKNKA